MFQNQQILNKSRMTSCSSCFLIIVEIKHNNTTDRGMAFRNSGSSSEAIRYCAVLGCQNTGIELNIWKRTPCSIHNHKFRAKCGCKSPFILFPFPNTDKLRRMWLYRIGLPDLEISESTCICSIHFVDGRPTSRSFFPTLFLQLEDDDELVDDLEEEEENGNDEQEVELDNMPMIKNTYHFDAKEPGKMKLFVNNNSKPNENETVLEGDFDGQQHSSMSADEAGNRDPLIDTPLKDSNSYSNQSQSVTHDGDGDDVQVLFQSSPAVPKTLPLTQYNPSSQTLQITDPVKYIMECHNRIAQLVSENTNLRLRYEKDVNRLKANNIALRRILIRNSKAPIGTPLHRPRNQGSTNSLDDKIQM